MCGICAVYSKSFAAPELKLFKQLLYVNQLRGMDSTGVMKLSKNGKLNTLKSTEDSGTFLKNEDVKKFMTHSDVFGYVGHTRAATIGSVTNDNAHPFLFKNVAGVHNGTVRKNFPFDNKHGTDSEAIYHNIDEFGVTQALKNITSMSSAYALVFTDLKDWSLNFLRNQERPMSFTFVFNRMTLLMSSTEEALQLIVQTNNLTATGLTAQDKDGGARFFTLNPHDQMKIKVGDRALDYSVTHIDVPTHAWSGKWDDSDWGDYHGYSQNGQGVYTTGQASKQSTQTQSKKDRHRHRVATDVEWVEEDGVWTKVYTTAGDAAEKKAQGPLTSGSSVPLISGPKKETSGITTATHGTTTSLSKNEVPQEIAAFLHRPPPVTKKPKPAPLFGWEPPKSRTEVEYKLSIGCMVCGDKVDPESPGASKVRWWSRDHYCCSTCLQDDWVIGMFFPTEDSPVKGN